MTSGTLEALQAEMYTERRESVHFKVFNISTVVQLSCEAQVRTKYIAKCEERTGGISTFEQQ